MSDFKGVIKNGWHPKGRDGGQESWRGDFKGINQVAGWMGKGKQTETQAAKEHTSRPLATLKDPASFGPPPKNVNYHGGAALPNEITPHRSGIGAPLKQAEIDSANQAILAEQEEESRPKPAPPPLPYRADRTGLKTDNLPPPPVHRDLQQLPTPPIRSQPSPPISQPKLPPRLPARQNTTSPPVVEIPPPSYETVATKSTEDPYLNQSAITRLGNAGISVPGFGIDHKKEPNPWESEKSQSAKPSTNQLSELQSRFAKMRGPSQDSVATSTPPQTDNTTDVQPVNQTSMPSWKQSQSALKTAQNLRTNPQAVTLADAQSAAQTAGQAQRSANVFREKHADSIANAQAKAKAWDQRYKVTSKINKFLDEHTDPDEGSVQQQQQTGQSGLQHQQQPSTTSSYSQGPQVPVHPSSVSTGIPSSPPTELAASIARKPPPPPAPRKPAHMQAPPPVPTGTKPSLG